LSREGFANSIAPGRAEIRDIATPYVGQLCGCHSLEADGFTDLALKIDATQLVDALGLKQALGQTVEIEISGNTKPERGHQPIRGSDCIRVREK
jgi:hypothetical protein